MIIAICMPTLKLAALYCNRCHSGNCRAMPTGEYICHTEIARLVDKLEGTDALCITEHKWFNIICLNNYVGITNCILNNLNNNMANILKS